MEKYPSGVIPSEAKRSDNTMSCRFRKAPGHNGGFDDHVWHVTCMRLMLVRDKASGRSQAIYHFDSADNSVATGLKVLITRDDYAPATMDGYTGLDKLVGHTIYIVNWAWTVFLREAGAHLKIMVSMRIILYFQSIG